VLVITVICSVDFKNGSGRRHLGPGDQTDFMTKLRDPARGVERAASDHHDSTVPSVKDVRGHARHQGDESMFALSHSHWNVTRRRSGGANQRHHGRLDLQERRVNLGTLDFTPENKGGSMKMTGGARVRSHAGPPRTNTRPPPTT